jgi:hypothetical protein
MRTETIAELQRKRSLLVQHGHELADERASVSFQTHCGHDPESRRRLGEINMELALLDLSFVISMPRSARPASERRRHDKPA